MNALHKVQGPNIRFSGSMYLSLGVTGSTVIYNSYKNIAGQPVKWINDIYESGIWDYSMKHYNGELVSLDEEKRGEEAIAIQIIMYKQSKRNEDFYLSLLIKIM